MIGLVLALALSAGNHGGGGGNHGGGGGGSHVAAPAHSAPAHAAAPPAHAAPPQGFNLPHDVPAHAAPAHPAPARPAQQPHPGEPPHQVQRPAQPMPHYQARPPAQGHNVPNPRHWSRPWQWNNGIAWNGASNYWGGGFWGPWALGLALGSYYVEPDTPGAELLQEYGLTQTPCGPPNLVEIFGPDGSEICAFPNQLVGPGQYEVDPTTLTLTSY